MNSCLLHYTYVCFQCFFLFSFCLFSFFIFLFIFFLPFQSLRLALFHPFLSVPFVADSFPTQRCQGKRCCSRQCIKQQTANKVTAVAVPIHGLDADGPCGRAEKSHVKGGTGVLAAWSCHYSTVFSAIWAEWRKVHVRIPFTKQPFNRRRNGAPAIYSVVPMRSAYSSSTKAPVSSYRMKTECSYCTEGDETWQASHLSCAIHRGGMLPLPGLLSRIVNAAAEFQFCCANWISAADQFPASRFEPRPRARDGLLALSWARSAPVGAC
ncbi:hypothetical protein GGI43DRAFT_89238 [Trichoderma evansii]